MVYDVPMAKVRRMAPTRMAGMNRRMWNSISDAWQKERESEREWRWFGGLVRRITGPVRGKKLLDLQCGGGEGALFFARRGAKATGVDISEERLKQARRKAQRAGANIAYIRGNVVKLPLPRNGFDLVHTGGGVTAWIPDIGRWAAEIGRVLKPGGRFVWWDGHPVLYCLRQRGKKRPVMAGPAGGYFDRRADVTGHMARWLKVRCYMPAVERTWTLSDILNATASAGLVLERMEEHAVPKFWWFNLPGNSWRALPRLLLMRWRKPRGRK